MKPVLVIGKSGQVAQALAEAGGAGVVCAGRPETDLLDAVSLERVLDETQPAAVINTGAFTSVDGAESEPAAAHALNATGPGHLAAACTVRGIPLIHLSTDCVFDGTKPAPYLPHDLTNPLGTYGRTKLEGERAVRDGAPESLVVRVSWIFSSFSQNFVRTMLRLAQTRSSVSVVCDQVGCPTYAPALARGLLELARQAAEPDFSAWDVYHLAGQGETNRAEMARLIFDCSRRCGGPFADVVPVQTADYPTPATRPLNARLDMSETTRVFGVELPDWKIELEKTVGKLIEELSEE
ncbi:dTDP-4-dehydrorhamnose reductase [Hyphomonas adhaerens]|uniref:dTDP-4-dehydrorhamnose reductase n=1 Tax=Hyphomonas adhaerens TaxID=81029 RepID=UPI002356A5DF|nr:dTDP-4-dehydrorhamnose reductase [Hyphomonas adhaerens]